MRKCLGTLKGADLMTKSMEKKASSRQQSTTLWYKMKLTEVWYTRKLILATTSLAITFSRSPAHSLEREITTTKRTHRA
jgi:hypothetical protein